MRDLNPVDSLTLMKGRCPFCGNTRFKYNAISVLTEHVSCLNARCNAVFLYNRKATLAQILQDSDKMTSEEPKRIKPERIDDSGLEVDGDAFLDFMSPPKDKTVVAKTKREVKRIKSIAVRTLKEYFEPVVHMCTFMGGIIDKLMERRNDR